MQLSQQSPHRHLLRALFLLPLVAGSLTSSSFCDDARFSLVWADEFNGSSLNTSSWTVAEHGPGESDTRDATAVADAVFVSGGNLVIVSNGTRSGSGGAGAWVNLTSGAVSSAGKQHFRAGGSPTRVCVRAKLPGGGGGATGRGVWPALWMMPDTHDCWPCAGEIDIMEMINGDGILRGTYHWSRKNHSGDDQQAQGTKVLSAGWGSDWHEYAAEYDGVSHVSFALDGKVYKTIDTKTISFPGFQRAAFFDQAYYFILNTALGGNWPRPPDKGTVLPTYHYVDYVRVASSG